MDVGGPELSAETESLAQFWGQLIGSAVGEALLGTQLAQGSAGAVVEEEALAGVLE
jgi:hypothetical protein